MGVPHSRKSRATPHEPEVMDDRGPRVEKRTRVDNAGRKPRAKRTGQEIVLVRSDDERHDRGRASAVQGHVLDAEFVDDSSGDGMAQQQVVPAQAVVEAQIVGYWDDMVDMTGRALAGAVSRKLRRFFK